MWIEPPQGRQNCGLHEQRASQSLSCRSSLSCRRRPGRIASLAGQGPVVFHEYRVGSAGQQKGCPGPPYSTYADLHQRRGPPLIATASFGYSTEERRGGKGGVSKLNVR